MEVKDHNRPGLYVHVPFCIKKCPYCAFYSEPIGDRDPERFVSAVIAEMNLYSGADVSTISIGGGSPSCLPVDTLMRLVEESLSTFTKTQEFTVEVNPSQASGDLLKRLYTSGVNRLSIGGQSFSENELTTLGRLHGPDEIDVAVRQGRDAGFANISLDLIFAIPGSTTDSWRYSLDAAISLGVEHISAYSLTYEKGTQLSEKKESGAINIVDERLDRAMYETAIDVLQAAGFGQYEISNFAKAGFQCKHNVGYWQNREFIGLGPAAGSWFDGKRTMNIADINGYLDAVESGKAAAAEIEESLVEEIACETMVLGLRMIEGVELDEFKDRTGFDAMELFAEPIGQNQCQGLIEIADGRLHLTRKALPIADTVLCDFAAV
jgi:oxygen-independent coproporphyrinogen-3 oxidase